MSSKDDIVRDILLPVVDAGETYIMTLSKVHGAAMKIRDELAETDPMEAFKMCEMMIQLVDFISVSPEIIKLMNLVMIGSTDNIKHSRITELRQAMAKAESLLAFIERKQVAGSKWGRPH